MAAFRLKLEKAVVFLLLNRSRAVTFGSALLRPLLEAGGDVVVFAALADEVLAQRVERDDGNKK